jgi:hypothetical protein
MPDSFDEFKKKRDQGKSDAESLAKYTGAEWDILKGFVSDFAGKDVDGHIFEWFAQPYAEMLVLNYASASLLSSRRSLMGIAPKFTVHIDRRPPGPRQVRVEDRSPIPPKTWTLEPRVEHDEFHWTVLETGWKGSSLALADEVAKAVVAYYDEYKKKYPQAV